MTRTRARHRRAAALAASGVRLAAPLPAADSPPSASAATGAGTPTYAAIDLGTHNCRMLVARPDPARGFRVVESFSRVVRLGEGLAGHGRLAEPATARTIEALRVCARRLRRHGIRRVRAVATEACRRAANGEAFLARVRRETGLDLVPISPDDEARLTLAGCAPLIAPRTSRALLFDIGGGSTEVSWIVSPAGRPPRAVGVVSLPFGVVDFAERYGCDRVDDRGFKAMVAEATAGLVAFDRAHRIADAVADGGVQMLGTSGTVTTLAAVSLGLARYERSRVDGRVLDFDDIARVSRALAETDIAARAANPCIGPERADLVVPGCAILRAIVARWPVGRLTVADRGIREGLLLEMITDDAGRAAGAGPS